MKLHPRLQPIVCTWMSELSYGLQLLGYTGAFFFTHKKPLLMRLEVCPDGLSSTKAEIWNLEKTFVVTSSD
jgi:hypothetical protein